MRTLAALIIALGWARAAPAADADIDPSGRPEKYRSGLSARYAVWHDGKRWHLRTTAGAKELHQFGGTIVVDGGKITELKGVNTEKRGKNPDLGVWNADHSQFKFLLTTGKGSEDGVDFEISPEAKTVKFSLLVDGRGVTDVIYLGKKGEHPAKTTFTLPAHPAAASKSK